MKRLVALGVFAVSLTAASAVFADGYVVGGIEVSGYADVVTGWQHDDKDVSGAAAGGLDFRATAPNADAFNFYVDQIELDIAKTFGENIRLRSDIDFYDIANFGGSIRGYGGAFGAAGVDLEQAYVTANIAAGNGMEFLIGRFNIPVGIESADRNDNHLTPYSYVLRFIQPNTSVIGAKLYYVFSDLIDLHFAVVQDLNQTGVSGGVGGDSAIPSTLFRLGFTWGEEGMENTVGLAGGFGPENAACNGGAGCNAHWDFFGDVDYMLAATESVSVGGEVIYRQTDSIAAGRNQKAIATQLLLNYELSDVWDFTFRYGWLWDINPAPGFGGLINGGTGASTTGATWSGIEGNRHQFNIGAGYMITDGAKMKVGYEFDIEQTAGPAFNADIHALTAEFAYAF